VLPAHEQVVTAWVGRVLEAQGRGQASNEVADTLARTLAPIELPLSVLTVAVGHRIFLWLLGRRRRLA
jgi:ABC-type cobalamin transport system permease subunit